jgi:ribosomal protein L7/L12
VRAVTGLGLAEAKAYVERLGAGSAPPAVGAADLGLEQHDAALRALVARGQTIEAIKRVRAQSGMGLREAKDYVDGLGAGERG